MSVEAWNDLAGAIAACPDDDLAGRMASMVERLGLTDAERQGLDSSTLGREDPAGVVLRRLLTRAPRVVAAPTGSPTYDVGQMDAALELADRIESDPAATDVLGSATGSLEALPAHRAGSLVRDLVARGGSAPMRAAVVVGALAPMSRLPVEEVVGAAREMDDADLAALATVLAEVPRPRLLGGLAAAFRAAPDESVVRLVGLLADRRQNDALSPPPTAARRGGPPRAGATRGQDPEPVYRGPAPAPPPVTPPTTGAPPPVTPPTTGAPPPVPSPVEEVAVGAAPETPGTEAADRGADAGAAQLTAYPRIDLETGTARPDVVVLDRPFTVSVGLGSRPSFGIVSTGPIEIAVGTVDVVITYDPASLVLDGAQRHTLQVTEDDPYPTVEVTVTARYLEDDPPTRRIGVHYLVGEQVVGVAWRRFVVVDDEDRVTTAPAPPASESDLLDLRPVLGETPPDLVLAVCRADSGDRWVWSTYAADPAVPVTDAPDVATLDGEVAAFATATRRAIQFSTNPYADFLTLAGRAKRIGASVPAAVHEAVTGTLAAAVARGDDAAPAVLLLTEELLIPWELAALTPAPTTPWGGTSPFLGAHVAISRWPLTERRPRPVPRTAVEVRAAAVVTADYAGVPGWGRLEAALAEAAEVVSLFEPPAVRVEPDLAAVIQLLRGTPPADVVHVALHGQYDQEGEQEGIVLLRRGTDGSATAQFLTPVQLETGELAGGPFIFLNACQVGTDERVLGAYGGFASTLLRIGASAVIAPLWNIDDTVAAEVARSVYAVTLGPPDASPGSAPDDLVPVAEAVRRVRAGYTEEAVLASAPGVTATLIAFQVLGHPRLRLRRADVDPVVPAPAG